MPDLDALLADIVRAPPKGATFERTQSGVRAFTAADRSQGVRVAVRGDDVFLTSLVAPKSCVPDDPRLRGEFLRRLWEINAHTDLVAFGIDGHGRVVGSCQHPLSTLDRSELELYLVALVRECDRLEWVLTGDDRF